MKILGQARAIRYLSEGLRRSRLSPSLMFVGPSGVGKKRCALELAKGFACDDLRSEPTPEALGGDDLPRCDRCPACRKVDAGRHPDVLLLDRAFQAALLGEKPEAQTAIKIDAVRSAEKFLYFKPGESRRRTVIVDEAHKMTNDGANAFLKVLEEPPPAAQIVLVAADERALPPTLRSRCAVLRFPPVPAKAIAAWLEERHAVAAEPAAEIAERAAGSFERALHLKDEEREDAVDIADYRPDEFFELLGKTN